MFKLLSIIVLLCLASKFFFRRWPWELLASSARSAEVKRAQILLGLSRTHNRDQIIEAHRRLVTQVHPDRGGTAELVHEANAARDLLLDHIGNRLAEKS